MHVSHAVATQAALLIPIIGIGSACVSVTKIIADYTKNRLEKATKRRRVISVFTTVSRNGAVPRGILCFSHDLFVCLFVYKYCFSPCSTAPVHLSGAFCRICLKKVVLALTHEEKVLFCLKYQKFVTIFTCWTTIIVSSGRWDWTENSLPRMRPASHFEQIYYINGCKTDKPWILGSRKIKYRFVKLFKL